ncbi:MAG TPA: NAD-dependent protein deacetylase [Nocardioidaceae bacterium]|nr:NAD-dependent protein deacetylase [Nocardioidaceae bacterium]
MTALPVPATAARSVAEVVDLLADRRFVALTGAGMSTDSGIPDYRGPNSPSRTPMTYSEFVSGPDAQQRYWARSHLGWSRMRGAAPNDGHRALVTLERSGRLRRLITQNVDGLHEAAGSRAICALHGRIADVVCLGCSQRTSRAALHERMRALNPGWREAHAGVESRPDGDVELSETSDFRVPSCVACGGVLKPDVVFFGENVPKERVESCYAAVDALDPACDALLVLGSSLTVMSGFRFVRHAGKRGVPVVVVNRGATRADDLPGVLKLAHGTTELLTTLVERCGSQPVEPVETP